MIAHSISFGLLVIRGMLWRLLHWLAHCSKKLDIWIKSCLPWAISEPKDVALTFSFKAPTSILSCCSFPAVPEWGELDNCLSPTSIARSHQRYVRRFPWKKKTFLAQLVWKEWSGFSDLAIASKRGAILVALNSLTPYRFGEFLLKVYAWPGALVSAWHLCRHASRPPNAWPCLTMITLWKS